jgi:radical SAM protein with 4Fe4S-binding SPASM domain
VCVDSDLRVILMSTYVHYSQSLNFKIRSQIGAIDFELTERCNNNCIHCYINQPENDISIQQQEISTKQVKNLLLELSTLGCLEVRFTGGEPLLRSDFEEIYIYTRKLGMKVRLFTNARLITQNLIDLFLRIPPLLEIEVTVYGMTNKSYDAVTRVHGSFIEFWNGVSLLKDNKIPFIVKSVALPQNKHDYEYLKLWSNALPWMKDAPNYSSQFFLRSRRDDLFKNEVIKSLRIKESEVLSYLQRNNPNYRQNMIDFAKNFLFAPNSKVFTCGIGNRLCIDAYGSIQPCMSVRDPEIVLPSGLSLPSAKVKFQLLKEITSSNSMFLQKCARCFLRGLCEQCPAKSYAENGTLDTPIDYYCNIAHEIARYIGLINEREFGWQVDDWQNRLQSL